MAVVRSEFLFEVKMGRIREAQVVVEEQKGGHEGQKMHMLLQSRK